MTARLTRWLNTLDNFETKMAQLPSVRRYGRLTRATGLVLEATGLQLPLGAEVHQDLVFDTAGGIGGQAHVLVRLEGTDPLDQSDGADGDQIVLIPVGRIVLFHDVRHQAQVVLDEDVKSKEDTEKLGIMTGDIVCFDPRTVITKTGYIKSRYTRAGIINGRTNAYKKAVVTLKEGDTIDFYSNI